MKIKFSNFVKLFLAGASLLAVGCTDYGQDIQNLRDDMNDRFDALQTETIDPLRADLTKVQQDLAAAQEDIKAQAAKHEQDLKTLQDADAKLQEQINTNVAAINELKGDLKDAVDALEKAIKDGDDALAAKINETKENLTGLIEGHVNDLQNQVDAINKEISGLKGVDTELQNQINALVDALAITNANVSLNAEAIATNKTDIAANKESIKVLDDALKAHVAEFVAYKGEVAGLIASINAEIDLLKAKDVEIEGLIAALDARLKANEELAAKNAEDIKNNKAEFDAYVAATAETLRLMQEAHDALVTKVGDLEKNLEDHKAAIRKELDEHYAAFAQYQDKVAADFALVNETLTAHLAAIEANAKAIEANAKAIEGLDTRLTALEGAHNELAGKHDELKKAYDAYVEKTDAAIGAIQAEQVDQNAKIKLNADQIAALQTAVSDLDKKVDSVKADLEKAIADLEKKLQDQIDVLKGDLTALKNRVQSLVFVPDHVDGAATIHWAEIINDKQEPVVVEGQSVLKFQVYPAECAAAIKPADLKFVFTDALAETRTNAKVLDIVAVEPVSGKEGVIAVTVNARNFSDEFYYGDKKYAASLVFKTEIANIGSCYVNLAPATPKAIEVALVPNKGVYSLPYTPAGQKVEILPEHKYVFTIDGKGANTVEGMIEAGYEIVVTKHKPVYTCSVPAKLAEFKNVEDLSKPYLNFVTVELAEPAKPENVGLIETITYSYTVCGKTVNAVSTVEVTKVKGSIDLKTTITWNYADDAKSDAGLELTNSIDLAEVVATNFPEGINYQRVIDEGKILSKSIKLAGKEITDVTVDFLEGTEPKIEIENFLWNKTYNVAYVYDLPSCTITVTATIETVDRLRNKIAVELVDDTKVIEHATSYEFKNSLVAADQLKGEDAKTIFEQIVANNTNVGEMKEADFLKEVLVTKKNGKYACSDTYNGATATDYTNLAISAEGVEATVKFSYVDVTTMPGAVKHVYNVTTWYNQEIEIVKNVILTLPTTYDFKHIDQWVTLNSANTYYSKVLAEYEYQPLVLSSLYSFNTKKVDMESAFDVVCGDTTYKTAADAEAANIFQEFILTPTQKDYSVLKSEFNGLKLDYKDYDRIFVNVTGKLYLDVLVGTASEKKALATSFSEGGLYHNYYVQRFEFDNAFTVSNATLYLDNAVTYEVDILSRVKLTDNRPNAEGVYSLLQYTVDDHIASTENVTYYDRDEALQVIAADANLNIADVRATFTKGDGKNGFAEGMNADAVYMPFHVVTELDINSVPVGLRTADQMFLDESKLKYDAATHRLTIDGSAQLNLTEKVELEFTVKLMYDDVVYKQKPLTLTIKPLSQNKQ